MRSNIVIYWVLGACFLLFTITYTTWNLISSGRVEWFGSIAFCASFILMSWLAIYVTMLLKRQGGELPEDRDDADIDDGDPELGEFSPHSWWPITLAGAASLILLGLAIGFWLIWLSLPVLVISLVGWVYEGYRGHHAR